jgi:adenosine deaminase CECR1
VLYSHGWFSIDRLWQVLVASEITGLVQLGRIAKESIMVSERALAHLSGAKTRQHSMLEKDEKDRAVTLWTKRWEGFLEYVVAEGQSRSYVQNK